LKKILHRSTHLVSGHHLLQGVGTNHIATKGTQAAYLRTYACVLPARGGSETRRSQFIACTTAAKDGLS